ncbi:CBU_0592 family membrane protein [Christiangramia portivictoriae]|uniref:CBU_0592 family membrane protein n=1 Tax=Christiangramia portivictoriae TaxID=326069 RepID=UPI0003FF1D7A|nr:hypothetical protein [Christiangramia portivictoriae]
MTYIDWIGSAGVFLILLAYVLNAAGKLGTKDLIYILMNFIGASLACYASVLMDYVPFIILEAVWATVSLFSLIRYNMKN